MKSKSDKKRRDVQMAAANDKEGAAAEPFNDGLKKGVEKVMGKIKDKKKKLPNVVETTERRVIQAKREFTKEELEGLAKRLTDRLSDLTTVEEEKKSVMANYTDKIKAHKLDIGKLARHHRDGYELVDHDCFVVYDYKKREVRFKSVNTKAIVEVKPFGPGDDQRRLPI